MRIESFADHTAMVLGRISAPWLSKRGLRWWQFAGIKRSSDQDTLSSFDIKKPNKAAYIFLSTLTRSIKISVPVTTPFRVTWVAQSSELLLLFEKILNGNTLHAGINRHNSYLFKKKIYFLNITYRIHMQLQTQWIFLFSYLFIILSYQKYKTNIVHFSSMWS